MVGPWVGGEPGEDDGDGAYCAMTPGGILRASGSTYESAGEYCSVVVAGTCGEVGE
jgi:hypothetical protein